IVLVGLLATGAGFYVQSKGLLSVDSDFRAVEENTLLLNEVMAENISALVTEAGEVPDWIEITNAGDDPVEIGRYSLLLDANFNRMYTFPEYTMQPGEYLVLYAEGMKNATVEEWSLPFKLSASGGEQLVLMNPNSKAVDMVELPELGEDEAYCRMEDGSWTTGRATPGETNDLKNSGEGLDGGVQLVPGDLVLTEAMASNNLYFADENGEYHDYVEIHNTSSMDVNLEGWFLADSSDALKDWAFPAVNLPAGGYLAVHCSGLDRTTDPNHLHTDFKIGSDGECIYLTQPDGQTVSTLETIALLDDQAYSLVNGAWTTEIGPTPGMENTADAAGKAHTAAFGDRSGSVYISEIMAVPSEQEYDWIELYNGSSQAVDLSDYGLSDNSHKPRKWQFPQGTIIQPGQYMGIYLSGQEVSTLKGFINADFALAAEGHYTVTLAEPDGKVIDAVYLTNQYGGVSCGRAQGEEGFFLFEKGTPGVANTGNHYRGRALEAQASVQGGLFKGGDSFTVELSAPAGHQIYYTLDCSDPDQGSQLYSGPISISNTTILRTRVYRDGYMPSSIDTQSYLYDVNNEGSVYVVSVVSDPDNLFSNSKGIMVKGPNAWAEFPYGETNQGANFWMDWEREGHVELFEADGDPALSQRCGLKLHGQYSRATNVKAFKVIARNEYGDNRFDYPIFSERDYEQYQSFLLRASGQDYNMSFMRDSVLSSLAKGTSLMYQESEVGICYLNGEYYSLFNLRERVNKHSICQFEGWEGMEDDIDLIKANNIVMQGSNESFEELLRWVKKNDMSTQAAYDYLDSKIDIENYIEYMVIETYVANNDTLNVKRYRNAKADGKWRWVLFDLDWGFKEDSNSVSRWLNEDGMGAGGRTDTTLFIGCMKNPTFREQFITRLAERMATDFTSESMMKLFMERYEVIDGFLPAYQRKWGIKASNMENHMEDLVGYIKTRPAKMLTYTQKALKLSDSQMKKYFGDAIAALKK
ncbi:MAG: lamin tail domain-containing protein, partial [Clostridia bacterium]|nr:lamin tail domain-containing protein [Clostridia bacterium]